MCGPIIGIVLSVVGSLATAVMTSQMASQQAKIQQEQLRVEMENERISAMGATNDRLEELRKAESTNRAALSTTGLDVNYSYSMGIAPYNKTVAGRDIGRTEFNAGQVIGRKKYEIAVAGWKAKADSRMAYIGAAAQAADTIGSHFISRASSNSITPA